MDMERYGKKIHPHIPKYYYLRETLREEAQRWPANFQIPSEADLCDSYNVSRTTVRKALDHLIFEGLLYRVQGKGTYVSPPKAVGRFVQSTTGFWNDARSQGLNLRTMVIEQRVLGADSSVAQALQIEKGTQVFKLMRLRFIDNIPVMLSPAYVPYDLCAGIANEDFVNQSFYQTLQEKYDVIVHHGTQMIEARPCSQEDADFLEIDPGTPILVTIGTMCDHNNLPVEYSVAKSRWDRLHCEVKIVSEPD